MASELISKRTTELGDWRGETLSRARKLIKETAPAVVEEWKWMGAPVWSHDGIICMGESYKKVASSVFFRRMADHHNPWLLELLETAFFGRFRHFESAGVEYFGGVAQQRGSTTGPLIVP